MELIKLENQWGGSMAYCPNHIIEHQQNLLGRIQSSVIDGNCPDCTRDADHAAAPGHMEQALLSGRIIYTRARKFGGSWHIYAYRRDDTSPSGVLLDCSLDADRFHLLFGRLSAAGMVSRSLSPLSPTEGL